MFPITRFRIKDKSMEPAFREGDYVLACKYLLSKPRLNDVVVSRHGGMFVIKRITEINGNTYTLQGGNKRHSSRIAVSRKDVIGKVLLRVTRKK